MAYNELLADRIRKVFIDKEVSFDEKKMMGGLTFMVNDKMCVGVSNDDLMAHIDPERYNEALEKKGEIIIGPTNTKNHPVACSQVFKIF